uniref:Uncharacterized protein n=1 Tax=uncultured marine thaumarchaeote KM3_74_G04 TaxID=1456274 RepID=A0A075HQJ7_9ARCH|nr:hypothetical protein [uncultured marine thaumarchaeote KM3_74_G04]
MDEQIIKILVKKISEIKTENNQTKRIIDEFSNLDSTSFSSGLMIGRLFNSFYYQHRRILKRNPTDNEFDEFLKLLKKELG